MGIEPTWQEHIYIIWFLALSSQPTNKNVLTNCVWNNPWIYLSTPCMETQVFGRDVSITIYEYVSICTKASYIPTFQVQSLAKSNMRAVPSQA